MSVEKSGRRSLDAVTLARTTIPCVAEVKTRALPTPADLPIGSRTDGNAALILVDSLGTATEPFGNRLRTTKPCYRFLRERLDVFGETGSWDWLHSISNQIITRCSTPL
jgi:hypothetical protein